MERIRKVAANYIYLPSWALVKNGYVEISDADEIRVIDTGEQIRDIAGLEFYGGLIVAGYACEYESLFESEKSLLPVLESLYFSRGEDYARIAIIEGADLKSLTWKTGAKIRML